MSEIPTEGSYWPTRAQELLLRAACGSGPSARDAWVEWQESTEFDLIDGASQQLVPLLYQNLLREGLDGADLGRCKGLYRRAWYTNQILFHHLENALGALKAADIRTMLLGGAALAVRYYRDPGVRPLDRGDILVPADQATRAVSLLKRSGWAVVGQFPRRHAWDFLGPADQRLTLHGRVPHEVAAGRNRADPWDAAAPVLLGRVSTVVLDHTDQLLDACASGILWTPSPAVCWAVDLLWIVRSAGADIDWERLVREAERCRISLPVGAALGYVQRKLAAAVPAPILARTRRHSGGLSGTHVVPGREPRADCRPRGSFASGAGS